MKITQFARTGDSKYFIESKLLNSVDKIHIKISNKSEGSGLIPNFSMFLEKSDLENLIEQLIKIKLENV